jgi:hypothetical protein
MLVIALTFEIAGWYVRDQSFLLNTNRLILIVLQVAAGRYYRLRGLAITTGDLSSGSGRSPPWWRQASRKPPIASLMFFAGQYAGDYPDWRDRRRSRSAMSAFGDPHRPAVYRDAWNDGVGARSGAVLHQGNPSASYPTALPPSARGRCR